MPPPMHIEKSGRSITASAGQPDSDISKEPRDSVGGTLDHVFVETSAGKLGFVGRIHAGPARPSLLMVGGAFPPKRQHEELVDWFPGANVLIAFLPGMAGVPWSDASAPQLTVAVAEAIALLFGDRPIVICGGSTSGLVVTPLQAKNIHRKIILEPFFTTQGLWPFISFLRNRIARNPDDAALRRYVWSMYGYSETEVENRDYRYLVDLIDGPTDVVVGGLPLLPVRPFPPYPSFTSVEDRALLAAHPDITLHEGPAGVGHDLWSDQASCNIIRSLMLRGLRSSVELL